MPTSQRERREQGGKDAGMQDAGMDGGKLDKCLAKRFASVCAHMCGSLSQHSTPAAPVSLTCWIYLPLAPRSRTASFIYLHFFLCLISNLARTISLFLPAFFCCILCCGALRKNGKHLGIILIY